MCYFVAVPLVDSSSSHPSYSARCGAWPAILATANSTRRMAGLHYAMPECDDDDGASAFANGRIIQSAAGDNLTDIAFGLDACCGEDDPNVPEGCYDISVHQVRLPARTLLACARIRFAFQSGYRSLVPNLDFCGCCRPRHHRRRRRRCMIVAGHRQCDCGIPDAATCTALNVPGSPQRFFWTPGNPPFIRVSQPSVVRCQCPSSVRPYGCVWI